ncbi:inorganic pyrophosphatase, mitochondrial [[Candida] jaroonii]|uniref:Inorganic pyrophosphatase, mitochondrial n=1 Tax=[Candida] jaroonii TaxID=467808 RepID=A0ACA9Y070_9ASCO|nr:inorganic pyrophosphatase, mitochondrial [[Candida] jaroonii]
MPNRAVSRLLLTSNHLNAQRSGSSQSGFHSVSEGSKYSSTFKKYLVKDGNVKSYFHDLPLELDVEKGTANMVVEIPRWSNAKFEISTKVPGNPIMQDVKKGQVRFIKNLFPFHGYCHNYGAFPQTWEDITNDNGELQIFGDNDPLDVIEIGSKVHEVGDIVKVKIIGSLALIDDGELDWKVLAINTQDPLSKNVNDIPDIKKHYPGLLDSTREWIRNYKIPDGKPPNQFAFDGQYKDRAFTLKLIEENHHAWNNLIHEKIEKSDKLPIITNTAHKTSPGYIEQFQITPALPEPPASLPPDLSNWYYAK